MTPQETVERALAASRTGDCIVIAEEKSTANLRWAGNTLTTNGVSATRQLTVIAIDRRADGVRAGVMSRAGVRADQIEDVVRAAEQAAADGTPAEDAAEVTGDGNQPSFCAWEGPARATDISVLRDFATALGETMRGAQAAGRKLYGFAEHEMTSTFLGTSA